MHGEVKEEEKKIASFRMRMLKSSKFQGIPVDVKGIDSVQHFAP
jgi:hypothetical protein